MPRLQPAGRVTSGEIAVVPVEVGAASRLGATAHDDLERDLPPLVGRLARDRDRDLALDDERDGRVGSRDLHAVDEVVLAVERRAVPGEDLVVGSHPAERGRLAPERLDDVDRKGTVGRPAHGPAHAQPPAIVGVRRVGDQDERGDEGALAEAPLGIALALGKLEERSRGAGPEALADRCRRALARVEGQPREAARESLEGRLLLERQRVLERGEGVFARRPRGKLGILAVGARSRCRRRDGIAPRGTTRRAGREPDGAVLDGALWRRGALSGSLAVLAAARRPADAPEREGARAERESDLERASRTGGRHGRLVLAARRRSARSPRAPEPPHGQLPGHEERREEEKQAAHGLPLRTGSPLDRKDAGVQRSPAGRRDRGERPSIGAGASVPQPGTLLRIRRPRPGRLALVPARRRPRAAGRARGPRSGPEPSG